MSDDSYHPNQDNEGYQLRSRRKKKSNKLKDPDEIIHKEIQCYIGTVPRRLNSIGQRGNLLDPTVCLCV